MARIKLLNSLGMGLVLSLALAVPGTMARADAETDSPFQFDPPFGWTREVSSEGRVYYIDPEGPTSCFIEILPVVPNDLSAANELWIQKFFDAFFKRVLNPFEKRGIPVPDAATPPRFERFARGIYIIEKDIAVSPFYVQAMILLKDGQLQRLSSIVDSGQCRTGVQQASQFFRNAATLVRESPR
jgi:hypothetical protein